MKKQYREMSASEYKDVIEDAKLSLLVVVSTISLIIWTVAVCYSVVN